MSDKKKKQGNGSETALEQVQAKFGAVADAIGGAIRSTAAMKVIKKIGVKETGVQRQAGAVIQQFQAMKTDLEVEMGDPVALANVDKEIELAEMEAEHATEEEEE